MLISNSNYQTLPRESRLFVQKTARSIVEVQHGVNNLADIVVFLEVLGYNKEIMEKYGFSGYYELAHHVYDFIDFYYDNEEDRGSLQSREEPIPTQGQRLAEGLGLIFPWLGALLLLFLTGVSLWMALSLPIEITTLFVGGVFLGLILMEGPLQAFHRLFTFHYEQENLGEVKRILKRCYATVSIILAAISLIIVGVATLYDFPLSSAGVIIVSMVTVSLHRASYMVIFALKKIKHLMMAYSSAFVTISVIYLLGDSMIPSDTTRYFTSLVAAFAILSVFSVIHHHKMMTIKSLDTVSGDAPHFYNRGMVVDTTLASRFSVQMWETLPTFLFGLLYFITLFADRVLSWFYNPAIVPGEGLFIQFNSAYHSGVDLGLMVLLASAMLQYVMMAPIHIRINNLILRLKITEAGKINEFIREQHSRLVRYSLLASGSTALIFVFLAPQIMAYLGGTEDTAMLLRVAAISNVFISLFVANNMFLSLLNKTKELVCLVAISASITIGGGLFLGSYGYENIVFAYMASAIFSFVVSSIYLRKTMKNADTIYFSRYV